MRPLTLTLMALAIAGCPAPADTDASDTDLDTETQTEAPPRFESRTFRVTLDDVPVADAVVVQGGINHLHRTGTDGTVTIDVDFGIDGEAVVHASHPEARILANTQYRSQQGVQDIPLVRFDASDNAEFDFQHPGTPEINSSTEYCAHCHVRIIEDWAVSVHRTAASNPELQDLFSGTASSLTDKATCEEAGGSWWTGITPGTGEAGERCYLGTGVLPDLNDCGDEAPCDGVADETGACADCHAPGIDGQLGGRDLLDAVDIAFEYGVQCDSCHKVESIVPDAPSGVAGRLHIVRPSELAEVPIAGPYVPLQFGPSHDIANPRMGSVQRDHYRDGTLCMGCHEHSQAVLVPGQTIDRARWPDGRLPVHSTFSEWQEGPFGGEVPCNACHMPPDAVATNGADLQIWDIEPGVAGGWVRPPGAVRHHSWLGPRSAESRMLELAAGLTIDKRVQDGELVATVTTTNAGPAHFVPTGEPSRTLVLHVQARCGERVLAPTGGDAIPDFAGSYASKHRGDDWTRWPRAKVGDTLRLVRRSGWRTAAGWGPFGDGTFSDEAAGMSHDEVVHIAVIEQVKDGFVTLDSELPPADVAYLGPPLQTPTDAQQAMPNAGAPGSAFARVLVDQAGTLMVPHHRAVDVRSDNRLAPGASATSTHRFATSCEDPVVDATLTWRAYPAWLAAEKHWSNPERVMQEVSR